MCNKKDRSIEEESAASSLVPAGKQRCCVSKPEQHHDYITSIVSALLAILVVSKH